MATNLKFRYLMTDFELDKDEYCFIRTGEDGDLLILPLFGGDEFVGNIPEGHWKKGWDSGMDADQTFTAILDGSGALEFEGEADVAGTWGSGWLESELPIPLIDELEITFSMQVPVDDTGGTADRDIDFRFYLRQIKTEQNPTSDTDTLLFWCNVDEDGLYWVIYKEINGSLTALFSGSTYDDESTRATGDIEAAIWRLVFHGKPGTPGAHVHIYLKQADTIANAESATEYQVTSSPGDLSDLRFHTAYPAFSIRSQNTTYFDSGGEAKSTYVKVDYPEYFEALWDRDPSNFFKDDVELWDGDPDSGGQRVFDPDHEFTDDLYLQNGLQRIVVEATPDQIHYYAWDDGTSQYDMIIQDDVYGIAFRLNTPNLTVDVAFLRRVILITPEKAILQIRLRDTSTEDEDYFADFFLTLERGRRWIELSNIDTFPLDNIYWTVGIDTYGSRMSYQEDGVVSDDAMDISNNNTTMSDNYALSIDKTSEWVFWVAMNKPPDEAASYIRGYRARTLSGRNYLVETIPDLRLFVGVFRYPLYAWLFAEAEDETLVGGATSVVDALASGGDAVLLDAQNEESRWYLTAGTEIPSGRYVLAIRARDLNQVADDLRLFVYNGTDSEYRNELNSYDDRTLTADYLFYYLVFDITDGDVSGTDQIRLCARKSLADANEIYVDYFVIFPIGNGEEWPQDLGHAAMRDVSKARRIITK